MKSKKSRNPWNLRSPNKFKQSKKYKKTKEV